MDFNKIDEYHDIIDDYIIKITERCIRLWPLKWEAVAKEILYLHNTSFCDEDADLKRLVQELYEYQNKASEENPYINIIDKNS